MNPADIADVFLAQSGLQSPRGLSLRRYQQDWFRYDGRVFRKMPEDELRGDVTGFLRKTEMRPKVTRQLLGNVITHLEAVCIIPAEVEWPARESKQGWLSQSHSLVMQNGILELPGLRVGTNEPVLSPHTPAFISRVCLPYDYDPHATCPRWLDFLQTVLPDLESQQLVKEVFGYCLTYDLSMQKFFLFVGSGGNGKGVTLNILRRLLGADNVSAVPLTRFGGPHDLIETHGKLVNITNEVGDRLDEDILKQYVAGDLMYFNPKHKRSFSAKPTAKLLNATNELPDVKDCSDGFWRRIVLLPFDVAIPEEKRDHQLEERLAGELAGILNWSVAGAGALYLRKQFIEPKTAMLARQSWRRSMNPAGQFLEEHYEASEEGEIGKVDLYRRFCAWCTDTGHRQVSRFEFYRHVNRKFPFIMEQRPRTDVDQRPRIYRGIGKKHLEMDTVVDLEPMVPALRYIL